MPGMFNVNFPKNYNLICADFAGEERLIPTEQGTEPILAWRAWKIIDPGYLKSMNKNFIWEPIKPSCGGNAVAGPRSGYGLYAFKSKYDVIREYCGGFFETFGVSVYGSVWLWGKVVEHAIGYRAEFGYPADLYVSPNMSTEDRNNLESRYQVPVSAWDPSMVDQIVAAEEEYKNKKLNAANEVIKMQYPMQHYTGPVVFHC
jgi:hypothetical protein